MKRWFSGIACSMVFNIFFKCNILFPIKIWQGKGAMWGDCESLNDNIPLSGIDVRDKRYLPLLTCFNASDLVTRSL